MTTMTHTKSRVHENLFQSIFFFLCLDHSTPFTEPAVKKASNTSCFLFAGAFVPFLEMDLQSNFALLHCGQFSHFDLAEGLLCQLHRKGNQEKNSLLEFLLILSLISSIKLKDQCVVAEQFSIGLSPFGVTTTTAKNIYYLASKSAIFVQLQTPASNARPGSRSKFSQQSRCQSWSRVDLKL